MTTPAVLEPVTNTATHPTIAPAPPRPVLDPQALLRAAIDTAELNGDDMRDLKVLAKYVIGEGVWAVDAPPPGRDDLRIVALFEGSAADLNDTHAPGDVRAYVMPLGAPSSTDKRWFCYTLSRAQPLVYVAAIMSQEKFIDEMANELAGLAGVRDAVAEENETLRETLEKVVEKAAETTTPALNRLVGIGEMAAAALGDEEDEEDGE